MLDKKHFEELENLEGKSLESVLGAREDKLASGQEVADQDTQREAMGIIRRGIAIASGLGISVEPQLAKLEPSIGGQALLGERRTEINRDLLVTQKGEAKESILQKAVTIAAVYIHEKVHHLMHELGVICSEKTHEGLTEAATREMYSDAREVHAYDDLVSTSKSRTNVITFVDALKARDKERVQKAVAEVENQAA